MPQNILEFINNLRAQHERQQNTEDEAVMQLQELETELQGGDITLTEQQKTVLNTAFSLFQRYNDEEYTMKDIYIVMNLPVEDGPTMFESAAQFVTESAFFRSDTVSTQQAKEAALLDALILYELGKTPPEQKLDFLLEQIEENHDFDLDSLCEEDYDEEDEYEDEEEYDEYYDLEDF